MRQYWGVFCWLVGFTFFKGVVWSLEVLHGLPPILFLKNCWPLPLQSFSANSVLDCSPSPKCCSLTPDFPPPITLYNKLPFGLACGGILWKWTVGAPEMPIHLYLTWNILKEKGCGTTEQVFYIITKVLRWKGKRWDLKHRSVCQHVLINSLACGN